MEEGVKSDFDFFITEIQLSLRLQGLLIQLNLSSVLAGSQNLEYIVVS